MELVLRGLMLFNLLDCPEKDSECQQRAAVLIVDTAALETAGGSAHRPTLVVPMHGLTEWTRLDGEESPVIGGPEGLRRMAVPVHPGDRIDIGTVERTGVRRMDPGSRTANAPRHPLPSLRGVEQSGEPGTAFRHSTMIIHDGDVFPRGTFGAAGGTVPKFRSASRTDPHALASELVIDFGKNPVVLELKTAVGALRLRAVFDPSEFARGNLQIAVENLPINVCSHSLLHLRYAAAAFDTRWLSDPQLEPMLVAANDIAAQLLSEVRSDGSPCIPRDPPACPPFDYIVDLVRACDSYYSIAQEINNAGGLGGNLCGTGRALSQVAGSRKICVPERMVLERIDAQTGCPADTEQDSYRYKVVPECEALYGPSLEVVHCNPVAQL